MNFVIGVLVSTNSKDEIYYSLEKIVDCLTKIVYNKYIRVIINVLSLVEVIIDIVVCHYNILKSIIMD